MTTGKTIALTSWTFVGKVTSLLFNMMSRFFMNSLLQNSDLKKVGKTIRPFTYDPNQIPDDYTGEVTNRFKGLDLIDRVPE